MSYHKAGVLIALLAFAGVANALTEVVGAPEIDPASALSGLTLLAGSLAVLRGRRYRKP